MKPLSLIYAGLLFIIPLMFVIPQVGDTTFLADQLDQIQQFKALFRGDLRAFYGPVMSGTNPPVYNFGPLGAVLFGVPSVLGADPNQLHIVFIAVMAFAFALCFYYAYRQVGEIAYFWFGLLMAVGATWWHFSLIWVNIFLLPLALGFAVAYLSFQENPRWNRVGVLVGLWGAGLHIHSTFLILTPLVLFAVIRCSKADRRLTWSVWGLLGFVILPYVVAEVGTGFKNFQAALMNLGAQNPSHKVGREAALAASWKVFEWIGLDRRGYSGSNLVWVGGIAVVVMALRSLLGRSIEKNMGRMFVVVFCAQAVFFLVINRELAGPHYVSVLMPFFVLPWALGLWELWKVVHRIFPVRWGPFCVGTGFLFWGAWHLQRHFERSDWSFTKERAVLKEICQETPKIATLEALPFKAYWLEDETLLAYIAKRYVPACELSTEPQVVLIPRLQRQWGELVEYRGVSYRFQRSLEPGIGIYMLQR